METIKEAKQKLEKNNQNKVLQIFEKIPIENKEELANEILNTNFEEMDYLYKNVNKNSKDPEKIEPIGFYDKNKMDEEEINKFQRLGEEVVKNNKYAVVTMAGGQGTRL